MGWPKGINPFVADEDMPEDQLRLVHDGRMGKLGHFETRKGLDYYSNAAGETEDDKEESTTGAADQSVSISVWKAIKFTTVAAGRLTKVEINAKIGTGVGPLLVDIYDDDTGEPGELLASSSINPSDMSSTYAYEVARFIQAPALTISTDYWIVLRLQDTGSGTYNVSSTTTATSALTSSNSGSTWASTSYDINFRTYISTNSPTLGGYRAYKSDGTAKTLLAHGTVLYAVDDNDGSLDSVKTGLSASATNYRFEVANDIVYYVNGFDAPRKWDFTTEAAVGDSPDTASNIKLHRNQMFYVDAADPNKIFWSDIADFETFTSTNFLYVPSPKHSANITALESLNGALYVFTERNKYAVYGSDLATFTVEQAPGTKGTFSQESLQLIRNFIFFVADDGVYRFDGTEDKLISAEVTEEIRSIADKSKVRTAQNKNRFYIFYPSAGSASNDRCLVYNIDYDCWESIDQDTYVNFGVQFDSNVDNGEFVQFSNLVGQVFYAETEANNYSNLGKALKFKVWPRYETMKEPESRKRMKRLYARFRRLSSSQNVEVWYDTDFANSPTQATTVSLNENVEVWGGGAEWGDGTLWDGNPNFVQARISIPGRARNIQPRYEKEGVDTPVRVSGQVFYFKTKRAR